MTSFVFQMIRVDEVVYEDKQKFTSVNYNTLFKKSFYYGNLKMYIQVDRSTYHLFLKNVNQFFSILFQEGFD